MSEGKVLSLACGSFTPVLEPCRMQLGGSGPGTLLKEVRVRQLPRQEAFKTGLKHQGHYDCCCALF